MRMDWERREVPQLEEGTLYGDRYRIISPIGRGGMGRVYLAEDIRLNGRKRALKVTASLQEERDAFFREARLLAGLQHPHLPDIVDYYPPDADGFAVIVMEYVAGETLGEIFARSGYRLPFARVFRYAEQLCGLLCYLHGRKPPVVFRDLKPSNVLIDHHDRAILVDFGIARPYRPDAARDTVKLGTPAFAAPEQLGGRQTDARSDLYSWGAMVYYLLSGGQTAAGRTGRLSRTLQEDVPAEFIDMLERVLAENPSGRPQSAGELRRLLMKVPQASGTVIHGAFPQQARQTDVTVAAILSAYPGAGATFATLGLSKYLSMHGVHHALVEMPGGDPELYGLLNGERSMPRSAVFADPSGSGETMPAWRERAAGYYPVSPDTASMLPEPGFSMWLRRLGVPIVLLDVSSKWERPGLSEWLLESGIGSLWWVADCLPAKWSLRRQEAGERLSLAAAGRGAVAGWIANRDHAFPGRRQWLSALPAAPAARLPLLAEEAVIRAAWEGQGYPAGAANTVSFARAFEPWARRILSLLEK